MAEPVKDVVARALDLMAGLTPGGKGHQVISSLVLEVMYLREELSILLTRARYEQWPDLPGAPLPPDPPPPLATPPTEEASTVPEPNLQGCDFAAAPKPSKGQARLKLAPRAAQLLTEICKDPGKTPREYALAIWGSSALVANVWQHASVLMTRKLIERTEKGYRPTKVGLEASA